MSTKPIVAGRLKFSSETEAAATARSVPNRQVQRLFEVAQAIQCLRLKVQQKQERAMDLAQRRH
jgi:hypothetical protein